VIWRYGKSGGKLPIFLIVAYFYVHLTIKTTSRGRYEDYAIKDVNNFLGIHPITGISCPIVVVRGSGL
jgi:hypothetical protein